MLVLAIPERVPGGVDTAFGFDCPGEITLSQNTHHLTIRDLSGSKQTPMASLRLELFSCCFGTYCA